MKRKKESFEANFFVTKGYSIIGKVSKKGRGIRRMKVFNKEWEKVKQRVVRTIPFNESHHDRDGIVKKRSFPEIVIRRSNSWANRDTWSAKISFTFYSRTTMRTSWRKLVRPGRPVLLPISHSVVRRGGGRGRGISFFRNPICIYNGSDVNASPSHARIRWKHRWYGNYDTFFSLFFCFFFFFFSLFFSFRPKRDRRTIIIYSFGRRWYLTLYRYLNRLSENRETISWAANIRNKWASIQSARHVFVARRYWGNSNRFRPIGTSNRGRNYRSISNFISFSSRSVPRQWTHGSRRERRVTNLSLKSWSPNDLTSGFYKTRYKLNKEHRSRISRVYQPPLLLQRQSKSYVIRNLK